MSRHVKQTNPRPLTAKPALGRQSHAPLHTATGYVPTKFAASLTESDEARRAIEEQTLVGRLGTIGDMAAAVAYLASDDAGYVTAETLVIAGGMQSRL